MTGHESDGAHRRVVIIGAGPTGMTAALLLARYGVPTLVLDRWEDVYPQPRAVHLDDEVYRILDDLGLGEDFAAISRPGRGLRLCTKEIRTLAEFERDPDDRPHGYPQANMFDQPDLERLMRSHVSRYDLVEMRGGCEITDVQNLKDGVRVSYNSTEDATPHWVTADYVLGCDGANSVVRRSIGSKMQDLGFEQRWLVIDIETDVDLDQWDGVHQVCDSERSATYMRIGTTRYRWEFQLLDNETLDEFTDLSAIHPLIAPWFTSAEIPEMKLIRSAEYTFRAQVADRWRDRRVFVLGDAAHLTPPFIGQGMGAGVRDARNLVWKLVGALDGHVHDSALDSYEIERKTHAKAMIELAVAIGWAMTGGSKLTGIMRTTIAPALGRLPFIGAKATASTTPSLTRSQFVLRSRGPIRTLPGKLCPNSIVDSGARLDDVAPGQFLLVSSTPLTIEQRREVERRGAAVVEVAASSDLGQWLSHGHAVAAIVRPDRTVMAASKSVPSLHTVVPSTTLRTTERTTERPTPTAPTASAPAAHRSAAGTATRTATKRRR
ncbi:3-(3-hydroxy-phenyl)propionate hydroxylase [Rhodococcus sp. AW25M09]|uniref:bifunctional 3-(3-hydroxy-phenyl)propionate/3-hydroxycinnamic acid hydroxylase MhpA n=1 Tax=Rhodococcus sp. AW25M09 TaxID=1268303 RepID=UPI0002AC6A63|nr:bifunctional 3-(3-hydroxy-phenyl)propionate/3-hydroxycinnamic acid hydroxylase [Rhodococcus sp. AW25M09]CCQ14477.1 3-(3-hydroxy-phenyl)propionate hydroxylase [Rhodococcus sp. AW25M09]